jgi:hypothetical protein
LPRTERWLAPFRLQVDAERQYFEPSDMIDIVPAGERLQARSMARRRSTWASRTR